MSQKKLNIAPGYILVDPIETKYKAGDIEITGKDTDYGRIALQGKVLEVGDKTYSKNTDRVIDPSCKKGDKITYSSVGWERVNIDNEDYHIVPFSIVLIVYE